MQKTLWQLVNYFWVAGLGFIVDFGILYFCTEYLKIPYLLSAIIGFLFGLTCNFALSERFVFRNSTIGHPIIRFSLFGLIGLIGLGFLELLMWIQVDFFEVPYLMSKLVATVAVYSWNFVARKMMYQN